MRDEPTTRPGGHHLWRWATTLALLLSLFVGALPAGAETVIPPPIAVGNMPARLAINATTNRVYVANTDSGTVSVIDGATGALAATIDAQTGGGLYAIAVDARTNRVYVTNRAYGQLTAIDAGTNQVLAVIPVANGPFGVAIDETRGLVYVPSLGDALLHVIAESTNAETDRFFIDHNPYDVALNVALHRAYVTNYYNGDVSVVDLDTRSSIAFVPVGQNPLSVAVDARTNRVYVAAASGRAVDVIDGNANTLVTEIALPYQGFVIAVDSASGRVYVGGDGGGPVTVIDANTNAIVQTFRGAGTGTQAGLGINPRTQRLYVASEGNPGVVDVFGRAQTIALGPLPDRTDGDAPFTVSATASSGLPVTFTAAGACIVSGATVTLTNSGTCTLTAHQAGDAGNDPATVAGSFTVKAQPTPAQASVPSTVTFPDTQVGQQSTQVTFNLTNTGGSPLNVSNVTVGGAFGQDFSITFNNCIGALAPQASCTIGVRFAPTGTGDRSSTISITDGAADSPQVVTLVANGTPGNPTPAPVVSVAPSNLMFAATVGQQTDAQQVTVTNTGNAALTVSNVTITGPDASQFNVAYNNCAGAVAPQATCTIGVRFAPTVAQTSTATLQITDDAASSPQTVSLTGTGNTTPAPVAAVSPSALGFPSTQVGQQSNARQITVTNTGGSTLNVTGVTIAGTNANQFALDYNACTGAVAPGASCVIGVRFVPTAAQNSTATLQIADNAANSPQAIALSGTGTAAPQPAAPQASVAPQSLAFPGTTTGQQGDFQSVTVTNTGGSPLAFAGVTVVGANAGDFTLAFNSCTGSIQPQSACVVAVRFAPTAVGARAATLQLTDNAASSPQTVALTGTGVAPAAPAATYTIAASVAGSGTVSPMGTTTYASGATATYAAAVGAGQTFTGWTLDGKFVGYANPLTITVTSGHTLVATFVATPRFNDIAALSPADQQAITFLAAAGIINPNGVNDSGSFQPGALVNRAQMAAFIARTFGWEAEFHANNFPDRCEPGNTANCIDPKLWNDVAALKDYGIVGGYTDAATCQAVGTTAPCYLPRDGVKMIQVVSIVARAFIKEPALRPTGIWDRLTANPAQYTNVPDSGTQRSDLATYRANAGAIPGQASDAAFPNPEQESTRLFVIQILYQAYASVYGVDRVP